MLITIIGGGVSTFSKVLLVAAEVGGGRDSITLYKSSAHRPPPRVRTQKKKRKEKQTPFDG